MKNQLREAENALAQAQAVYAELQSDSRYKAYIKLQKQLTKAYQEHDRAWSAYRSQYAALAASIRPLAEDRNRQSSRVKFFYKAAHGVAKEDKELYHSFIKTAEMYEELRQGTQSRLDKLKHERDLLTQHQPDDTVYDGLKAQYEAYKAEYQGFFNLLSAAKSSVRTAQRELAKLTNAKQAA